MKKEIDYHSDESLDLAVYVVLLCLTAATLAASLFSHGGRIMAVSIALVIASMKASFIGFYYMGLRRERALAWYILGVGAVAVLILLIGLLPDMTFARF
ncbi:MAG: cytochrome C oxidase subunit IV family protein [Elusimicrobia bacterium]|nr:cytochrome C oxidase subunit IV family protein [Elusimicrobiota bacterium]